MGRRREVGGEIKGFVEIVEILPQHGGDPYTQTDVDKTPLNRWCAVRRQTVRVREKCETGGTKDGTGARFIVGQSGESVSTRIEKKRKRWAAIACLHETRQGELHGEVCYDQGKSEEK
jgi:hypothetical protein